MTGTIDADGFCARCGEVANWCQCPAPEDAADPVAALGVTSPDPDPDPDGLPPPPPGEPDGSDPGPGDRQSAIVRRYASARADWDKEWDREPERVDWIVEPVIEAGTINVLFARAEVGKSLIALEWALRAVRQGRAVIYIDQENRLRGDVIPRLKAMGATPGELKQLAFYSFASLPPLDTVAGGVHLLALAEDAGAALVILDTTTRMIQGKENDADTFLALYRCSLLPLKKRGIAVLRLDHPGKDETRGQRGSSAKDGDCDTIWRLTETIKGKKYKLHREKNRTDHGPEDRTLDVERRYAPVRHVWTCPDSGRREGLIEQLCGQLFDLGIPPSAGRDRCRAALNEAGTAISNELLSDVVRQRRFAPDSSADSRTAQSSARPSVPPPTTHVVGGGGRTAHRPRTA